jgi:excisionase family DNA binding protein
LAKKRWHKIKLVSFIAFRASTFYMSVAVREDVMGALALDFKNVHEPTVEEIKAAGRAARVLAGAKGRRIRVTEDGGKSEPVEIPAPLFNTLIRVLAEIGNGNAIAVVPIQAELTTQQAADLLNVSRPHLIALLERKKLPFHMAGTHRRIRAKDVLNYKSKTDQQREAALAAIAAIDQELGLYDDEKVSADD